MMPPTMAGVLEEGFEEAPMGGNVGAEVLEGEGEEVPVGDAVEPEVDEEGVAEVVEAGQEAEGVDGGSELETEAVGGPVGVGGVGPTSTGWVCAMTLLLFSKSTAFNVNCPSVGNTTGTVPLRAHLSARTVTANPTSIPALSMYLKSKTLGSTWSRVHFTSVATCTPVAVGIPSVTVADTESTGKNRRISDRHGIFAAARSSLVS